MKLVSLCHKQGSCVRNSPLRILTAFSAPRYASLSTFAMLPKDGSTVKWVHSPDLAIDELTEISKTDKRNIKSIPEHIQQRWDSLFEEHNIADLSKTYELIRGSLDANTPLVFGPEESLAYAAFYFNRNFAVTNRILSDVLKQKSNFSPISILDFGSGPGSSILSAHDVFKTASDLKTVEPSSAMSDILSHLSGDDLSISRNISLGQVMKSRNKRYDLILCNFSLSQVGDQLLSLGLNEPQKLVLDILFDKLSENGILVVCEDARLSRMIQRAREHLIFTRNHFNFEEDIPYAAVVAPCTHSYSCPVLKRSKNDPNLGGPGCYFTQKYAVAIQKRWFKKSKNKYIAFESDRSASFAYIAVQKLKEPPASFESNARILRDPNLRTKHVMIPMCLPDGSMRHVVVSKGSDEDQRLMYRTARKSEWGGLWPVSDVK